MIKIDGFKRHAYTLLIDGNDGEEQLVIITSSGQNGQTAITVVSVQVDLGMKVLVNHEHWISTYREGSDLIQKLRQVIRTWVIGGIPPTGGEMREQYAIIERILNKDIDHV